MAFQILVCHHRCLNFYGCKVTKFSRHIARLNDKRRPERGEVSRQSPYVVKNGFFVKTDERWAKVKYDEILWVRAFENGSVVFLTGERSLMVNHRLWRIEEMLTEHPNFVRINRSEIVNLDVIDGFEGNCYYIGKNPLYATGVYRQRMEGVFIKAKQQ